MANEEDMTAEERRSPRRSPSTIDEAEETREESVTVANAHGTSPGVASACAAYGTANGLPDGSPPSKDSGRSSNSSPLFSVDGKSANSSFSAAKSGSQGSLHSNDGSDHREHQYACHGSYQSPCHGSFAHKSTRDDGSCGKKNGNAVPRVASWAQYLSMAGQVKQEENELDMSELFLGQKFACGSHSRLYRGQYMAEEVAVKMVLQPQDDDVVASKLDRQFGQEVALLSRLHHPNVVEYVGAMREPPVFCIVTKYVSGGSLRAYLHKHQPHALPMNMVLNFAFDIARGMEYLHSLGVLHLDLKSHNLVLGDNWSLKVTDFGVARHESECASMTPDSGTYRWMAPEMISNKAFSTKADVYSFGIILWEIVTGQIPYEQMSIIQAAYAVAHKKMRPSIPERCPRALKQLMEECWHENPDKRPAFTEIVRRLEEFQECFLRNQSMQFSRCKCEKSNWFACVLKKLKPVCVGTRNYVM